jgi:hypothetical protein
LFGIRFGLRQFDVSFKITRDVGEFFVSSKGTFGALTVAQNCLCFFLITPEIRV